MTDSLALTVQSLLISPDVQAVFGERITPIFVTQDVAYPNVIVHLISEVDLFLLCGPSGWAWSRISIEMRVAGDIPALSLGARAVIGHLNGRSFEIGGYSILFKKEGTDVTDSAENEGPQGTPTVARRIVDFRLEWRASCSAASSGS